jgi:hypothetical protein
MGREALLMSVSPRRKRWKPAAVPELDATIRRSGCWCWYASTAARAIGKTVLDPSTRTVSGRSPQPRKRGSVRARIIRVMRMRRTEAGVGG